jgi:hypothetical protein
MSHINDLPKNHKLSVYPMTRVINVCKVPRIKKKEIFTMSGGGGSLQYNRIVTFSEVTLEATDWAVTDCPDLQGFLTYTAVNEEASITITRSDGKVLDFDANAGYQVQLGENVIRFHSDLGQADDAQFQ